MAAVREPDHGRGAVTELVGLAESFGCLSRPEIPDSLFFGCPATVAIKKKTTPDMLDENFHAFILTPLEQMYILAFRPIPVSRLPWPYNGCLEPKAGSAGAFGSIA